MIYMAEEEVIATSNWLVQSFLTQLVFFLLTSFVICREKYHNDDDSGDDSGGHKKNVELEKEIHKQFQLRKKPARAVDNEKAAEEINAKSSFIKAAASTRCKVKGLTLQVTLTTYKYIFNDSSFAELKSYMS